MSNTTDEENGGSALPQRYNDLIRQHQQRMYNGRGGEDTVEFAHNGSRGADGFLFPDQDDDGDTNEHDGIIKDVDEYEPSSISAFRGIPTFRISGLFGFGGTQPLKTDYDENDTDDPDEEVYAVHSTSAFGLDSTDGRKFAYVVLAFLVFCITVVSVAVPIYLKGKHNGGLGDTTFAAHGQGQAGVKASPNRTEVFTLNPTMEPTSSPTDQQGVAEKAPVLSPVMSPAVALTEQGDALTAPPSLEVKPIIEKVWRQRGTDMTGQLQGESLGSTVVLSEDGYVLAIGSPGHKFNSGRVQVFDYANRTWTPKGKPIEGDGKFGVSLDLSNDGNTIAIGGNLAANTNDNKVKGHVRVYNFDDHTNMDWIPVGDAIEGDKENENMGWSVSLSADGRQLAVGSPSYGEKRAGRVQLFYFDRSTNQWTLRPAQIQMNDDATTRSAGFAVSMSDNGRRVAIVSGGDPILQIEPHITVWQHFNETLWTRLGQTISNIGDDLKHFQHRVELSGDGQTLVVTARFNNQNGYTRVYNFRPALGQWVERGEALSVVQQGSGPNKDQLACAVNADGTHIALGSPMAFSNQGIVRVYQLHGGAWMQVGEDMVGPEGFGHAVSISADANSVAIGGGDHFGGKGMARVYWRHREWE